MQTGIYFFSDMFLKFLAYNLSKKASFVAHHGTLIASAQLGQSSLRNADWQLHLGAFTSMVRNRVTMRTKQLALETFNPDLPFEGSTGIQTSGSFS